MQRRHAITGDPRSALEPSATTDASVAVVRLAEQRSLDDATVRGRLEQILRLFTTRGTWSYLVLVMLAFSLLRFEADRWWLGTTVMLGPKWPGLLPLAVLVPLAAVLRARMLFPLALSSVVFIFGIMGLCVPWPWNATAAQSENVVTLLTCNVREETVDWARISELIDQQKVDVVTLQESGPNVEAFFPSDWQVVRKGSLVIASPFPINNQRTWQREPLPSTQQRVVAFYADIERPEAPFAICNVLLTSPRNGLSDLFEQDSPNGSTHADQLQRLNFWRNRESQILANWIQDLPHVDIVAGDFNMPVESRIYRRWWKHYINAFSTVGSGFGWTEWRKISKITYGLRSDHVLVNAPWAPRSCQVGPDNGSNHLPILVRVEPASNR